MQPVIPTVPVTKFGSWNKLFHEIIKSKSEKVKLLRVLETKVFIYIIPQPFFNFFNTKNIRIVTFRELGALLG